MEDTQTPSRVIDRGAPVLVDESGRLIIEANCLSCGYNLLGSPLDGDCPECGSRVGDSVMSTRLAHLPKDWLPTVVDGLDTIVTCGYLCLIALPIAMVGAAAGAMQVLGAHEPWAGHAGQTTRRLANGAFFASGALFVLANMVCCTSPFMPDFDFTDSGLATALLAVPLALVPTLFTFGMMQTGVYLARIARSLNRHRLDRQLRVTAWFILIGPAVITVLACGLAVPSLGERIALAAGPAIGFCLMFTAVTGLIFLTRVRAVRKLIALALVERERALALKATAGKVHPRRASDT